MSKVYPGSPPIGEPGRFYCVKPGSKEAQKSMFRDKWFCGSEINPNPIDGFGSKKLL